MGIPYGWNLFFFFFFFFFFLFSNSSNLAFTIIEYPYPMMKAALAR